MKFHVEQRERERNFAGVASFSTEIPKSSGGCINEEVEEVTEDVGALGISVNVVQMFNRCNALLFLRCRPTMHSPSQVPHVPKRQATVLGKWFQLFSAVRDLKQRVFDFSVSCRNSFRSWHRVGLDSILDGPQLAFCSGRQHLAVICLYLRPC